MGPSGPNVCVVFKENLTKNIVEGLTDEDLTIESHCWSE